MINRTYKLSSTRELFNLECEKIKEIFTRLCYPYNLIDTTIRRYTKLKLYQNVKQQQSVTKDDPIRVFLPFYYQKAVNSVGRQLKDLSRYINIEINPVFTSRKLKEQIKIKRKKATPREPTMRCICVTCVLQVMSYIYADTFNTLKKTKTQRSASTSQDTESIELIFPNI